MKFLSFLIFCLVVSQGAVAQNIGVGTLSPQQKLHVAGNIRVDSLAGTSGLVQYNSSGDLRRLPFSGNASQVLMGDGSWGNAGNSLPAGTIVGSDYYENPDLIAKGFRLFGSIPNPTKYFHFSPFTASAGTWAPTYYLGVVGKYSPPFFNSNALYIEADTVVYVISDNNFYAYNPVSDVWRFMFNNSASGFTSSVGAKAVWTGTEILVYGGLYTGPGNNGYRYNPATNVWTVIASNNQPIPRTDFAMQLIGQKLIVWGGQDASSTRLNSGSVFDLASNTWSPMTSNNAPAYPIDFTSTKINQNSMIIWGGRRGVSPSGALSEFVGVGAIYNVSTNIWTPVSTVNAPTPRWRHSAVWNPVANELIVFGGQTYGDTIIGTGSRYNPATNTWTAINNAGISPVGNHSAIWADSVMLLSGGLNQILGSSLSETNSAYIYRPSSNTWSSSDIITHYRYGHTSLKINNIIVIHGGTVVLKNQGVNTYLLGYPQGSRYFLSGTTTSKTTISNLTELYLYIKE